MTSSPCRRRGRHFTTSGPVRGTAGRTGAETSVNYVTGARSGLDPVSLPGTRLGDPTDFAAWDGIGCPNEMKRSRGLVSVHRLSEHRYICQLTAKKSGPKQRSVACYHNHRNTINCESFCYYMSDGVKSIWSRSFFCETSS